MPKTDPYNPFTDKEVLARLKKSPVSWFDGRTQVKTNDPFYVHYRTIKSDADHIAMAWMVELAKACDCKGLDVEISPQADGKWHIVIFARAAGSDPSFAETDWPLPVLAEALDWEGEKT